MTMRAPLSRYFLASVVLLAALVALFSISAARRTQRELSRQLEEKGVALADALETASAKAIRGNALMEEMIAQRLLDNARLLDRLLLARPPSGAWLRDLAAMNRLARVDLLTPDGRPYAAPVPPPPPPWRDREGPPRGAGGGLGQGPRGSREPGSGVGPGMMHRRMEPFAPPGRPEHLGGEAVPGAAEPPSHPPGAPPTDAAGHRRAMMMYMWGRRWADPREETPAPPPIRDRKFWEGSMFGVAIGARSFPGIIAVHADADYVLNFGREIGVQRQVEEMGRQPGIAWVAILDPDLTLVAHSDPERVGQRAARDEWRDALAGRRTIARLARAHGAPTVYEVVKPLALGGSRVGLLAIGLDTASMDRVWQQDRWAAVLLAAAVLALGVLGLASIFYIQHRHFREVRALEEQVERRERLASLGNMAAAVAHEIRNPLNAVSMGLERLGTEFAPRGEEEDYRGLLGLVRGEVRRLNGIVEEFLSLARPVTLRLEPTRAQDLLDEVARLVEPEARAAGVELACEVAAGLPLLRADRDRLKQALLNLALNAVQAMPGGGTLALAASRAGAAVELTVSDTGPGIAPEVRARLFEPYLTTKAHGLGLGLAIARRLVEAHGGRLHAENLRPTGTRMRVRLPLAGPPDG